MFIKRQGVPHFLASFNLGSHLPQTLKTWSPCEVEAYFLNKGIEKAEFFVKQTECPGIVLTDNKPVYQAKLNLDKDKFSSSLRLQNLLTNLSAKRFIIQLLSAQLPSPILTLVDFASRHPVEFDSSSCTVCKDNTSPSEATPSSAAAVVSVAATSPPKLSLLSLAAWKEIQMSCPDMRRAHSLLVLGAKLARKEHSAKDIKSYLRFCTVKQGLLVVLKPIPFQTRPSELLVIPRSFSHLCHGPAHPARPSLPSPDAAAVQLQVLHAVCQEGAEPCL